MHRRDFLGASLGAGLIGFSPLPALASHRPPTPPTRSRVKHSVCRWCYGSIDLDTLCQRSAEMGAHSVELLTEKEWSIPAKYGITCAVAVPRILKLMDRYGIKTSFFIPGVVIDTEVK